MPAPTNKADFYRRYDAGEFGNRPRTWPGIRALIADSSYNGLVVARSRHRGGPCVAGITKEQARLLEGDFRFNERMEDSEMVLQGELLRGERGLQLWYSMEAGVIHREAMREPDYIELTAAQILLKSVTTPSSYDDLMELLDCYPEAVIEFGTYAGTVGHLPHRNHVIWEVRNY